MLHRALYQDDCVMLGAGLCGGLCIRLLGRKISRKLSAQERAVVSATVEASRKKGAPTTPENNVLAEFLGVLGLRHGQRYMEAHLPK